MNYYEDHINGLMEELSRAFAVDNAIKEIKNNPGKYPEFDFWVPGYDAEGWAEKAIKDFDKIAPELRNAPAVFKLITMRHYRKLGQMYRKSGRKELVGSKQHANDTVWMVKKLHPELLYGKES